MNQIRGAVVTSDEKGRQNVFAKEPMMTYTDPRAGFTVFAERLNGRLAMIGFIAMIGAYSITGQILPNVF